jgi:hypothetical protein
MRRGTVAIVLASMSLILPGGTSAAGPSTTSAPSFIYQRVTLAQFSRSHVYVLNGDLVDGVCTYGNPQISVPRDVTRWEMRVIGIDQTACAELIEEGVPPASIGPGMAPNSLSVQVGVVTSAPLASTSVASGYTSAWYEDVAGLHISQDTTYISWGYNGSCASGISASGQWSWNSFMTLVSHGGTSYQYCSYGLGDTWSSMKGGPCPWTTAWTYYNHVRTYGWYNGSVTASVAESYVQGTCFPLWPHWSYAKTG